MSMFPPRPPKKNPKRGNPPKSPYTQPRQKGRIPLDEAMKLMDEGITRSSEEEEAQEALRPARRLLCE